MAKNTKKRKLMLEKVQADKDYSLEEAFGLVKEFALSKFSESIDVAVKLGIDVKKSEQMVRGSAILPHGTGKSVKVLVFTQGEQATAAKNAGADYIGMDDLAEEVKKGDLDFDIVIASPDAMKVVGKLGQILGPKGLMPNPKVGTVATDIGQAVENAKGGQVRYRTDKSGIIHCRIGSNEFEVDALKENLNVLLEALRKAKPSSSKGVYMKKVSISSTMGPGISIDKVSLGI
ncbi:MAG: 50S ribosomal protein L1 [Gammaproteobacteria bacterium TMED78]|nr:MAG: 50S ribosomal protein L1 [Gammaproteobacteria bacterium TMED78]|tara:strand:- start:124 stop:819 length:696 start_codon:yes stop_codon:yes gene_type:complete